MSKIITMKTDKENIYIAEMNRNQITATSVGKITSSKVSSEALSRSVRETLDTGNIRTKSLAMVVPEHDSIIKTINAENVSVSDITLNLPYEFKEFIKSGEESSYVYDYAMIPRKKGDPHKLLGVAVKRSSVSSFKELALDCGLTLERLVPESIAISDIIAAKGDEEKKYCFINIGIDATAIRIYNGSVNNANTSSGLDLRMIQNVLEKNDMSFSSGRDADKEDLFESADVRNMITNVAEGIGRDIMFYNESGIFDEETNVYVTGEGSLIKPLRKMLSEIIAVPVKNIREFFDPNMDTVIASMMGASLGAGIELY